MSKRTIYRVCAIAVILILAVVLFWMGKGHTFLLDNQEFVIEGKTYEATHAVKVSINGQKAILVKPGKRKKAKDPVAGPWHRIKVDILDEDQNVLSTVEKKFSVSLDDMLLVHLPALMAEEEPGWIQPFQPPKR